MSKGKALEAERNAAKSTAIRLDKARRRLLASDLKQKADQFKDAKPDLAALLPLEGERLRDPDQTDHPVPARTLPPEVPFTPWLKALLKVTSESDAPALSPDGKRLAAADGRTIRVWDLDRPRLAAILEGHERSVHTVVFSPGEGKFLVSGGEDRTIRVWDARTLEPAIPPLLGQKEDATVYRVAFNADGRYMASAHADGTVRLWDFPTRRPIHTLKEKNTSPVWAVAFSPDGPWLASGDEAGKVRVAVDIPGTPQNPLAIGYNADGLLLALRDGEIVTERGDALGKGKLLYGEGEKDSPATVVFSADRTHLAFARLPSSDYRRGEEESSKSDSTPIEIFDLGNKERASQVEAFGRVTTFALDREGARLAAVFDKGQKQIIRFWPNVKNNQEFKEEPKEGGIGAMAFSADGAILAVVGNRGVELLDTGNLTSKGCVPRNPAASGVSTASFSPGETLLALGRYGNLRLLDIKTGDTRDLVPINILEVQGYIKSLAFSPDGKTLTVLYDNGTVTRWQIDAESWRQAACAIANRNLSCDEWREHIGEFFKKEEPYHPTCQNPGFSACADPESATAGLGEQEAEE